MNNLHVKTGDTVVVISGKNKGKKGKVLVTSPKEKKVIVEGVNMVTKHVKPRSQMQGGSIVKTESALYACKVQLYCEKCDKGVRTAVKEENGKKVRVCKKCGNVID